jgi:hypothetical protein
MDAEQIVTKTFHGFTLGVFETFFDSERFQEGGISAQMGRLAGLAATLAAFQFHLGTNAALIGAAIGVVAHATSFVRSSQV